MNKTLLISTAMLAAGAALGMGVQILLRDDPPVPPPDVRSEAPALLKPLATAAATPEIPAPDTPSAALQKEIAARQQLAQTVARLEKELHEMKSQLNPRATANTAAVPVTAPVTAETTAHTNEPVFDEDALRNAGLSMATVKQTRQRFEQLEMDRLFLRDRAIREGWMGTVRYSNEVEKLEGRKQDINNSLGDEGYDAYLYATNQSNRVVIRDMLEGSPARAAGLLPGDIVLSYDRKRMFATGDLQKATSSGKAGETVAVEIMRNGQAMTLYLTRGPLGVYLDADSAKPQ